MSRPVIEVFKDKRQIELNNPDGIPFLDRYPGSIIVIRSKKIADTTIVINKDGIQCEKTTDATIVIDKNGKIDHIFSNKPVHLVMPFWSILLSDWCNRLFDQVMNPNNFNGTFRIELIVQNERFLVASDAQKSGDIVGIYEKILGDYTPGLYMLQIYKNGQQFGTLWVGIGRIVQCGNFYLPREMMSPWDSQLVSMQKSVCRH